MRERKLESDLNSLLKCVSLYATDKSDYPSDTEFRNQQDDLSLYARSQMIGKNGKYFHEK